ncbi:hypothetical protein RAS1_25530 [Phycisphaerae bacterium RAS1]|nr:hypothetical protein RAS1_25530 [Phycisphaerae bacterium RAS1]
MRCLRIAVAAGAICALAVAASAQYPAGDGRLLDRNPAVGDRFNYSRPVSPLMSGNALATGVVGRGLSLQSYSPIGDVNSFRGTLASGTLAQFRRDSVSLADSSAPLGGLVARSYYDPSTLAPTGGYLRGDVGDSSGLSGLSRIGAGPIDSRIDSNPATALQRQITGLPTPVRNRTLSSSLFGLGPATQAPVTSTAFNQPYLDTLSRPQPTLDSRLRTGAAAEPEPLGSSPILGTPADRIAPGQTPQVIQKAIDPRFPVLDLSSRLQRPERAGRTGVLGAPRGSGETPEPPSTGFRVANPSVLPGYDAFTDMQLALALIRDPAASWFSEMQSAIRDNPYYAETLHQRATLQAEQFIAAVARQPVKSFATGTSTAVNDELLRAESSMEIGNYYEAAERYDAASRLDPGNPLPLLGKGHALLAAGDYLSASVFITRGLERFPDITKFTLDLTTLLGGGETVDIRRADMMRRLKEREDPRLRFLLGYLEYHSGSRESGLQSLEQAALEDRSGSIISRYYLMLRGQRPLPPPRLPEGAPIAPPPAPRQTPRDSGRFSTDDVSLPRALLDPVQPAAAAPTTRVPSRTTEPQPAPRSAEPRSSSRLNPQRKALDEPAQKGSADNLRLPPELLEPVPPPQDDDAAADADAPKKPAEPAPAADAPPPTREPAGKARPADDAKPPAGNRRNANPPPNNAPPAQPAPEDERPARTGKAGGGEGKDDLSPPKPKPVPMSPGGKSDSRKPGKKP